MAVINTNSLSLVAQNNLNKSQSALGTAIERLSSGYRINSAKDDAAGQAIANRFTANIKGLTQAARNANDGISVAQTTEGALNEINNNLQRIRELSVQAANGSNQGVDLDSIQGEIQQRLDEIDRVSQQTQFNGVKVLAKDGTLSIQVGANDSETISINLKEISSKTLGLEKLDIANQITSKDFTAVTTLKSGEDAKWTKFSYETTGATTYSLAIGTDNKLYGKNGTDFVEATYDADKGTVTFGAAATGVTEAAGATEFDTAKGVVQLSEANAATKIAADAPTVDSISMVNEATGATTYYAKSGADYYNATIDQSTGVVTLDLASKTTTAPTAAGVAVTEKSVLEEAAKAGVAADLSSVTAKGTNSLVQDKDGTYYVKNVNDGTTSYFKATVDATNGKVTAGDEVVVDPLAAIDQALSKVDSLRSDLGAIQNRFESTVTNLKNTVTNLSAARSRIEDADIATEVSNMSKNQILQQAGTSVLAQANQVPQTVLSLLR